MAILAGLAAACATLPKPESENQDKLAALFAETYRKIEEVHIEPRRIDDLARAGLGNLIADDEHLHFPMINGDGILMRDGKMVHAFGAAGPRDYDAWGAVTSADVIATVGQSDRLRAMEPHQVYDLFMAGLTSRLGKDSLFLTEQDFGTVLGALWHRKFEMGYEPVDDGMKVARLDRKGELESQGLRLGDVITHVDGKPTAGLSKVEIFRLLKDPRYGKTALTIRRDGAPAPLSLGLTRTTSDEARLLITENDGIAEFGFVDVDYRSTTDLTQKVGDGGWFDHLVGYGFQASGILLDLRNTPDHTDLPTITNPEAAVRFANVFLGEGTLAAARSRHPAWEKEWKANDRMKAEGLPVVILVDSTTSGAAEMAAAALGDAGRALLIGGNTAGFGKLSTVSAMPTGGYLVTPSALAYSPAGYPIEDRGVTPHICAVVPGATLEGLLAVLRRGEGVIPQQLRTRAVAPSDQLSLPAAQRQLCPELPDRDDLAYKLGVAILKDPDLYHRLLH